jgi:diketogulonate reductase-like aldo/keto reductase
MVNQVQLHTRLAQEELVAYCHERNMVVTAFCPLSGSDLGDPVVRAEPCQTSRFTVGSR